MRQKMAFHIKDVPHYETPNPYGYDEVALAEKTRALKELAQLYPDVNPLCVNGSTTCASTLRQINWKR